MYHLCLDLDQIGQYKSLLSNSITLVNLRMNDALPVLIAVKSSFTSLVILVPTESAALKAIWSLISPDKPHTITGLVVLQVISEGTLGQNLVELVQEKSNIWEWTEKFSQINLRIVFLTYVERITENKKGKYPCRSRDYFWTTPTISLFLSHILTLNWS